MVEYSLLNILMVLFSTQVVSTYLGAFGNHKKNHSIAVVLVWGSIHPLRVLGNGI